MQLSLFVFVVGAASILPLTLQSMVKALTVYLVVSLIVKALIQK